MTAVVTGTPEEYSLDVSIAAGGEDDVVYFYSTDADGQVNYELKEDLDGVVTIYESEDGVSAQAMS